MVSKCRTIAVQEGVAPYKTTASQPFENYMAYSPLAIAAVASLFVAHCVGSSLNNLDIRLSGMVGGTFVHPNSRSR